MGLVCALLVAGCAPTAAPSQAQRADTAHYVQARLDAEWRGDGRLDRPSTVSPRFLLPNGWAFAMAECMNDSGFPEFDYDVAAGFTNGMERSARAGEEGLAWYYCGELLPTYDTVFTELDEDELDYLYEYYSDWLLPCLALEGAAVLNVPSRAEFGAGGAGQPGSWNPYLTASLPASIPVVSVLFDGCSPYPAGWSARVSART